MQTLGYIVYKGKLHNILPCIGIVNSYHSIEDKTKPILIIGLEEARKYSSSFSILNKKLAENLFWTFGKREKKEHFDKDIVFFQEYVLKNACSGIKYYYFNFLKCNLSKIKVLLDIIKNGKGNIFYINNKMIYLYREDYVLGFSKEIINYCNINVSHILKCIKSNENNIIYDDKSFLDYRIKKNIKDKKYVLPFILSSI